MHRPPSGSRLTPTSHRERLIRRGIPMKRVATQSPGSNKPGSGLRTATKGLSRVYRAGRSGTCADRRSVPPQPGGGTLDPQQLQQAVDLRHQRCTLRRIAREALLLRPLSTVGRLMKAWAWTAEEPLDPKRLVRRYRPVERRGHDPCSTFKQAGPRFAAGRPPHHRATVRQGSSRGYCRLTQEGTVSRSTSPPAVGFTSRCSQTSRRRQTVWLPGHVPFGLVFWKQGHLCRRILSDNGLPIARMTGEKPCRRALDLENTRSAPSPTPRRNQRQAERFISKKPSWRNGPIVIALTKHRMKTQPLAYPAIWGTINGRQVGQHGFRDKGLTPRANASAAADRLMTGEESTL